jgi:hypothetical protein
MVAARVVTPAGEPVPGIPVVMRKAFHIPEPISVSQLAVALLGAASDPRLRNIRM